MTEETLSRSKIKLEETSAHTDELPSEWDEIHYAEGEYRTIDVVDDRKNDYTLVEGIYIHEPTGATISIHPDPETVMGEPATHSINYILPIGGTYDKEIKSRLWELFQPVFDDVMWITASVVPEHAPISENHPVRNHSSEGRAPQTNIRTASENEWAWYVEENANGQIHRDVEKLFEKLEKQVSDADIWDVSTGVGYVSEHYERLSTLREVVRQNTAYEGSPVDATLIIVEGDDGNALSYEKGTPEDVTDTVNLDSYLDLSQIDIEALSPGTTIATVKLGIKLDIVRHPSSQTMQAGYKITTVESTPIDANIERGMIDRLTHKARRWLDSS